MKRQDILDFKHALERSRKDKKNSIRSKEFLERTYKGKDRVRENDIFGIHYIDSICPTDKWHRVSCTLVTEIDKEIGKVYGFNMLYMDPTMCVRVLENYLAGNVMNYPENLFTFKEFSLEKIRSCFKLPIHALGYIPWLDRNALGIYSTRGLIESQPKNQRIHKKQLTVKPKIETADLLQNFFEDSELQEQLENEI